MDPALIQRYASAAVGAETAYLGGPEGVTELLGGERHHVFRVARSDPTAGVPDAVVVRIARETSAKRCQRALREAAVLRWLPEGFGPDLFDFDGDGTAFGRPAMCIAHVPGPDRALREPECEALGSRLSKLHSLAPNALELDGNRAPAELDLTAVLLDRLERDVRSKLPRDADILPSATVSRVWQAFARVVSVVAKAVATHHFAAREGPTLLHGDVGAPNIRWPRVDGPVLLDWEDARFGDPAEEIAYVFSENRLTPQQRAAFADGYGRTTLGDYAEVAARVPFWLPVTALGSAVWWLERHVAAASRGEPAEQHLARAVQRLAWLEASE